MKRLVTAVEYDRSDRPTFATMECGHSNRVRTYVGAVEWCYACARDADKTVTPVTDASESPR